MVPSEFKLAGQVTIAVSTARDRVCENGTRARLRRRSCLDYENIFSQNYFYEKIIL
jgi:hypothetical protein